MRCARSIARAGIVVLGWCLAATPGGGQSLNFASGDPDSPIQVDAQNGIEWQREDKVFTARGDAVAVRGDVRVRADVLRAYYRLKRGGGTDIWRLEAEGNVRISSPEETAFGDKGVYDLDNAILVLSGKKVRLVTAEDEITANRQLEYWETKRMAVARGNAYAVREDRRLRADVLTAHFQSTGDGKSKIHRVDAFGNVHIVTGEDTVTAERGVYNVESGIADLTGSVRITRGGNQLNGCTAKVNMKTGISKLLGCGPSAGRDRRARGLIVPGSARKK